MKRRAFVTTLAAAAGTVSFAKNALTAPFFDLSCTPFNFAGVQQCQAGIQSEILDVTASDTQHASEWCWAACIEAVFSYYGHQVPQERIVKDTWGQIINMPGSPAAILSALNRKWKDEDGDEFRAFGTILGTNAVTAAQDLSQDHPLIIGALGHAMVLTSLQYATDVYSRGQVTLAVVRDPWPYNARRRALTPQEWFSINFAARIRVNDE